MIVPTKLERSLGHYFKSARLASKLTQLKVATKLGYTCAQFVSNCENGRAKFPLDSLHILVKLYSLDPTELIRRYMQIYESQVLTAAFNNAPLGGQ